MGGIELVLRESFHLERFKYKKRHSFTMPEEAKGKKSGAGLIIVILAVAGLAASVFVIIVIVVAALFAFGIQNPPAVGRCVGNDKMAYVDHSFTSSSGEIILANGAGSPINLEDASLGGDFTGGEASYQKSPIGTGNTFSINIYGLNLSGRYSGLVQYSYQRTGGVTHTETLTCTGSV